MKTSKKGGFTKKEKENPARIKNSRRVAIPKKLKGDSKKNNLQICPVKVGSIKKSLEIQTRKKNTIKEKRKDAVGKPPYSKRGSPAAAS